MQPSKRRVAQKATPDLPEARHVNVRDLHGERGTWFYDLTVHPVPFKLSYASEAPGPDGQIMIVKNADGVDIMTVIAVNRAVRVATDDEITTAEGLAKRIAFVRDLRAFADLLEKHSDLTIRNNPSLTMGYGIDRDALARVGEVLGIEPAHQWNREFEVEWCPAGQSYAGFSATWRSTYPQCPHVFDPEDIPGLAVPFAAKCVSWEGHDGLHKPESLPTGSASTKPAAK